ncbi:MAG: DUF1761 domain-containing protein [Pseudomonadota bacterium]
MEIINIIVAALGGFIFGAVWYTIFAKPWMATSGVAVVDGKPANQANPAPYIIGILATILVAGMMRHIFAGAGVEGVGRSLLYGAGLGAFISAPWLCTNYGFAGKSPTLMFIDAGYAIGGSATIGLILALF